MTIHSITYAYFNKLHYFSTECNLHLSILSIHISISPFNPQTYSVVLKISGIYSPNAYRGFAREFIKDLERIRSVCIIFYLCLLFLLSHHISMAKCRPRAILDIIKSGENFRISTTTKMPQQGTCERCGYISSQVLPILNVNLLYLKCWISITVSRFYCHRLTMFKYSFHFIEACGMSNLPSP